MVCCVDARLMGEKSEYAIDTIKIRCGQHRDSSQQKLPEMLTSGHMTRSYYLIVAVARIGQLHLPLPLLLHLGSMSRF